VSAAPRRLLLATRSQDKAREIRAILAHRPDLLLLSLDDAGVEPDPAEDQIEVFDTFAGNALAKARFFASRTGMPTLADDSGILVHALDGAPGVRSRRFSGSTATGQALDDANNRELMRRLAGLPPERRGAHYLCAAALAGPGHSTMVAIGACQGVLLDAPAGDGGFGYDPFFFLPAAGVTFGQLPPEYKNRISHRARAFRALATNL
jgi:XTP/dITP diphosphohydrolase